jgi:predicted nuclease with RNAse H fold
MRTVGIDLAAQPVNTGVCIVDWQDSLIELLSPNSVAGGDDELVDIMCAPGVSKVGIDAPVGWPDDFVEAIVAHHGGTRWPDTTDSAAHRRKLRLRLTDMVVATTTGRTPMSVSADRIAVAAMRCALLQHLVTERTGDPLSVDRSGTSGLVAEVYPAAALAVWGMDPTGYKGTGVTAQDRRRLLLDALGHRTQVTITNDQCDAMIGSDHLLDAFVCAVVAAGVVEGTTARPPDGDLNRVRREGWIHVPSSSTQHP